MFECALDDLNKFTGCGNGTDGEWRGKNLNNGPHRIVVRATDGQGNTNNLVDHKFVVGRYFNTLISCLSWFSLLYRGIYLPGVPKKTIHCLIPQNAKPIKAISLK